MKKILAYVIYYGIQGVVFSVVIGALMVLILFHFRQFLILFGAFVLIGVLLTFVEWARHVLNK